jgi:hypothetical protein
MIAKRYVCTVFITEQLGVHRPEFRMLVPVRVSESPRLGKRRATELIGQQVSIGRQRAGDLIQRGSGANFARQA